MKIKWYGQAAFRITSADGTSIVTDPYTPETAGYNPINDTPDIVIMSSDNDLFHCRHDLIPGDKIVINALEVAQQGGERTEKGITFKAIESMEMLDHPEHDPDLNGMYRFEVDGISIGHMGDVGNPLTDSQIDFFADVDILLALAGGIPTIELDDLKTVMDKAKPKLIIPMHFRTLSYKPRNIMWLPPFLEYFDDADVDFACNYEVELTKDDIPASTRVLVIDYVK